MESAAKVQLTVEDEMALRVLGPNIPEAKSNGISLAEACLLARGALGRV